MSAADDLAIALQQIIAALAARETGSGWYLRRAQISAVAADGTATITIAGGTKPLVGIKAAMGYCPIPNASCYYITDGSTGFLIDALAPNQPANLKLILSSPQSIPTGTDTAILWTSESVDNAGMWTSGAISTIVTPGLYTLSAQATWAASATGMRGLRILTGATPLVADQRSAISTAQTCTLTWTERLTQGAAISVDVRQDTGGALNLTSAVLAAVWLAP